MVCIVWTLYILNTHAKVRICTENSSYASISNNLERSYRLYTYRYVHEYLVQKLYTVFKVCVRDAYTC